MFQCLNRHEQPSSFIDDTSAIAWNPVSMPQSARATFKRTVSRSHSLMDDRVSMPQSARATFKPRVLRPDRLSGQCFNASIGTSNLQAYHPQVVLVDGTSFNASIGTSNLQASPASTTPAG